MAGVARGAARRGELPAWLAAGPSSRHVVGPPIGTDPPQRLDASAIQEAPGTAWCRAWTAAVDSVVAAAGEPRAADGVAIIALGGYARRELCPASDVDLLILHDGRADLEAVVRDVCYPLWDAGLSVGHSVHTAKSAVAAARDGADTTTALLERRLVSGARGRLDELGARVRSDHRRRATGALRDLAAADRTRRAGAGERPGMLEPDLKSGAGGLRDLHSMRWAAALLLGEIGLDPLVTAGYLSTAERAALGTASRDLLAARCALHQVLGPRPGGHPDTLRLDLHDEVAGRLGDADGDGLLRRIGLAGRTIARLHGRVWPQVLGDARAGRRRRRGTTQVLGGGILVADGAIELADDARIATDHTLGLRAIAGAARAQTRLSRSAAERLTAGIAQVGPLRWDAESRAHLDEVLRAGEAGLDALDEAEGIGLLEALLPEWRRVRGRPQRNPFHMYDLDTHLARTVLWLGRIADGALDDWHTEVARRLPRPDVVRLGAWLHDVGKALPGDHSIVGAAVVTDWMSLMGFDEAAARLVALMVRHHLLLPDAATRRDIDDPATLHDIAETIGSPELLDALLLLSLADGRATGPSAWSPWKEGLMARLHARVHRLLTDESAEAEAMFGPGAVRSEAQRQIGDHPEVLAALDTLPDEHLWAADVAQAVTHAHLLAERRDVGDVAIGWRPGPADQTSVLSLVAPDRRGLIADIAGVLAAAGVVVLDARAATAAGTAIDWFTVAGDVPAGFLTDELRAAATGAADVAAGLARRERRRDARPIRLPGAPAVEVLVEVDDDGAGRIEVHAPDWPGVLHRLAAALADAGCDLAGARVTTLGPEVRDTFFLNAGPHDADLLRSVLSDAVEAPSTHGA